ncbi:MAG: hypothetical protein LBM25_03900 [Bacteroidales bacterium]|jgi:GTP cyclohydrolase I|nr:hypothetical protein [Bacteroidales bacterium]
MKRIFLIAFLIVFCFVSCNKKEEKQIILPQTKEKITMKVNRFEKLLFSSPKEHLKDTLQKYYNQYKPLFNAPLSNEEYFNEIYQFSTDRNMIDIYNIVEKKYGDILWLQKDITTAFAILMEDYPNIRIPQLYSLILGPAEFSYAYSMRVVSQESFIIFALDLYSINSFDNNSLYAYYPKYIKTMLDSCFLPVDIMTSYLRNVTTGNIELKEQSPNATFLDIIIERGKFYYALKQILPNSNMSDLFRYTPLQMQWVMENEYNIWSLIIKSNILYSKERGKYMHLISEGPSTKNIENSPSRIADYIGYRIVEKYQKENKKTLKELFENTDAMEIINSAKYKPKQK